MSHCLFSSSTASIRCITCTQGPAHGGLGRQACGSMGAASDPAAGHPWPHLLVGRGAAQAQHVCQLSVPIFGLHGRVAGRARWAGRLQPQGAAKAEAQARGVTQAAAGSETAQQGVRQRQGGVGGEVSTRLWELVLREHRLLERPVGGVEADDVGDEGGVGQAVGHVEGRAQLVGQLRPRTPRAGTWAGAQRGAVGQEQGAVRADACGLLDSAESPRRMQGAQVLSQAVCTA